MSPNNALLTTLQDRLTELGGIAAVRLRVSPPPGQARLSDLIVTNDTDDHSLCELIDACLVEKAVSYEASVVAAAILVVLKQYVSKHRLGLVSGPDGFFQLLSSTRSPDVSFLSRERLPGGVFPRDAYPKLVPDLAVEVLSPGNTKSEMARKRREYFDSGVRLVWIVDCTHRSVAVFHSAHDFNVVSEDGMISGDDVLPGFSAQVREFFSDLDFGQPLPPG